MIDERIRIEYWPIRPSATVASGRTRWRPKSSELVDERRDTSRPTVSIPDVGNQPRPVGEDDEQDHAEEEVRHRVEDQRQPVADVVDRAAASPARIGAEREARRRSR